MIEHVEGDLDDFITSVRNLMANEFDMVKVDLSQRDVYDLYKKIRV